MMSPHEYKVQFFTKIRYRYTGDNRSIDSTTTRRFRKKMRDLTFEIISSNGAFAQVKGSDGNYYQWMPVEHLSPVHQQSTTEQQSTVEQEGAA